MSAEGVRIRDNDRRHEKTYVISQAKGQSR